jgi:hypothetical protein
MLGAEFGPGGDLVLYDPDDLAPDEDHVAHIDEACEGIRPGRWIMLTGVHPATGKFLLRWYRLMSLDDETADLSDDTDDDPTTQPVRLLSDPDTVVVGRHAMVEGPEWPMEPVGSEGQLVAPNLRAILLPGVIAVTTQTVKLSEE